MLTAKDRINYEIKIVKKKLKEVLEYITPEFSLGLRYSDEDRYEEAMRLLKPLTEYYMKETEKIFKQSQNKFQNIQTKYVFQALITEREQNYLEMNEIYRRYANILGKRFSSLITILLNACAILEKKKKEIWAYNQYKNLLTFITEYPHPACFPYETKQRVIRAFSSFHEGSSTELYFMVLGDRYFAKERYHKAKKVFEVGKNLFKQFGSHDNPGLVLGCYQKILGQCDAGIKMLESDKKDRLGKEALDRGEPNLGASCFANALGILEEIHVNFRDKRFRERYDRVRNRLNSVGN